MLKTKRITKKEILNNLEEPNLQGFAVRGNLTARARKFLEKNHYCMVVCSPWVFITRNAEDMMATEICQKTARLLG